MFKLAPALANLVYGRFVEFETANDLKTAVEKLDGREFKNARVTCVADVRCRQFATLFPC